MAVYRPSQARQQKSQTAPEEPNLVPIMNLFVTIIPFLMLLVVVSQVALVALNFSSEGGPGASGEGGGGGGEADKQIEIHLMLRDKPDAGLFQGMEIRDIDGTKHKLPALGESHYDFPGLNSLLIDLKADHADTNEIAVIVHPEVVYDTLIRTIDLCKQNGFPTVHYKNPKNVYFY
ncbi:MAG: biopolymer transporter ExbD [Candidatus Cloacimonadaceae bacterium]|jgi:biopolymer transport protein ExbD|nr:biopolymer transporter ExbD [Candidatus Cloacimonadota bacterium]MDY0127473.1 biopolymer transporter ExbD [Candidatus Cloacimonadaceae bacterium]MCB5254564.1 biopolymer transporter ExbD [Candidatus Cloacimonadota bacterium]MCK9178523.1 biopolymer transporter ExbD [Candidatus Cloacimonadota bacterium]MCK9241868.1 biopolymer transporter ExbD [Candidatus Cloacimonadota bacterium]